MLSKIRIDRKFWINLVCFILGGILLIYLITKYRVAPDIKFASLQLKTPEGKAVNISSYKGKIVFLNFWETWCGPCVQEMPAIESAREQLDSTQIVFITIAEEAPAKISAFRDQNKYHFEFLISDEKFSSLGVNTYPTTYILDREGNVILTKIGGVEWSAPENLAMLKEIMK